MPLRTHHLSLLLCLTALTTPTHSLNFLFNSFTPTDLTLIGDATVESSVIRLTNDSNQFSIGRAFHPTRLNLSRPFSTSFVFSILPRLPSTPGFGLAFVLSDTTRPPNAISGQFFGVFSNSTAPSVRPLLVVEFDTGQNPEFNDPDGNHVGIDLNNIESQTLHSAGFFNDSPNGVSRFVPIDMKSGQNVRVWIDFDPTRLEVNVTIAPLAVPRPAKPLISYRDALIGRYLSPEMFVGFSASKVTWVEAQRVLAWSLSDSGAAREINVSNLPVFLPESEDSRGLSGGGIAGVVIGGVVFVGILGSLMWVLCWWRRGSNGGVDGGDDDDDDEIEEWERQYWPHRFSYEELVEATKGFSSDELLGSGGFGRVYRGTLRPSSSINQNNNSNAIVEVAVKCVSHDSKQGFREFMAEISSVGRLQHKNLVQMRGWCRKSNEMMLVYDYMPNGSLNKWIFDKPRKVLSWEGRRRVLIDVAEGLSYLHYGWDQVVLHRDIKSSNILLDSEMRARLGDFGLAKLYQHGQAPNTTRVVGTLGYLAPELANVASPTAASDVYSFGVVVLEVACGKRPIDTWSEDEPLLIDWVRDLYEERRLREAADERIGGEYKVEEMEIVLKLGLACCHPDPSHRPTMKDVVAVLIGEEAPATPTSLLSELRFGAGGNGSEAGAPPDNV